MSVPAHKFHIHHERKDAVVPVAEPLLYWRRVGDVFARIALVLSALCLGVVMAVAVLSTVWLMTGKDGNLSQSMSLYTVANLQVSGTIMGIGFAAFVLLAWLCWWCWKHAQFLDGRSGTLVLVGVTSVFQLVIIVALQTRNTHWGDSWMIRDFVTNALKSGTIAAIFTGKYHKLFYDARLYFACYPFQATFFWVMYGLRSAFGNVGYEIYQLLAAVCTELGVVALVVLGQCLGLSREGMRVLKLLVALCWPMLWLSTFIYGNAAGCGLALVFLALQALAMHCVWLPGSGYVKPLAFVGASLVPLTLALCIKSTFILFAIAAVLAWIIVAVRQRRAWELVLCLVVIVAARTLAGLPFSALQQASGGYEFTGPLTTLNHLELGLRMGRGEFYVSTNGEQFTYAPGGWSNHANEIWEEANGDAKMQNELAREALLDDIRDFVTDPGYAVWFFSVKLATEWSDPTYQSLYYLSHCGMGEGDVQPNPADVSKPLGVVATLMTFGLDGYQTLTFVAAFIWIIWVLRHWHVGCRASGSNASHLNPSDPADSCVTSTSENKNIANQYPLNPTTLLIALTFFTGFGCYLLWEAKSVYVLPFAIVILPFVAAGVDVLAARISPSISRQ